MRGVYYWVGGIIALTFAIGALVYPLLPGTIATHWNAQGVVDGYMPKFIAVYMLPIIMIFLFILFIVLPKIDPKKHNIEKFRKHFDAFIAIIFAFLLYIDILTLLWNLGMTFNLLVLISPAIALLFYATGLLIENSKQNWFIGIRTPWTMTNTVVWNKTHKIGGKLFKICGALCLFGMAFPDYVILWVLVPIIATVIYLFAYSYFEYKKIKRR